MKYFKSLRWLLTLALVAGGLTTTQGWAQSSGLRDVELIDDCEGEVRMKFLYYRDAWAGFYCAGLTINYNRKLDDSYIYAIVDGTRHSIVQIDWSGSQNGWDQWYDDSSCKGGGIRVRERNGYDVDFHGRDVSGGDCWSGASSCKAYYASITLKIPQEWWGKSINFGQSGKWDGSSFDKSGNIIYMKAIPEAVGLQTTAECDGVNLTWSVPTEACDKTYYQVRRNTGSWVTLNPGTSSYKFNEAVYDDATYTLRTQQRAKVGYIYSNNQTRDAAKIKPIEAATNLKVEQENCTQAASDLTLDLEWTNDPTNLPTRWRVERSTNASFSGKTTTEVNRDRSWFEDDGSSGLGSLAFNQTYYYRVIADDDQCNADQTSSSDYYTTLGQPNAPTNVVAAMQSDNTIDVAWSHTGGKISSFTVERTPVNGNGSTYTEEITDVNQRSWTDNLVENCVSYQYRIKANSYTINSNECFNPQTSTASNTVQVQINDILNTFAADFLTGSKGFYSDKVRLDWVYTGNRTIDNFVIYRRLVGTVTWSELDIVDAPRTYYEDYSATAGKMYEYGVVAEIDDCGGAPMASDSHPSKGEAYRAVGFRTPSGLVNGKITFNGDIALEGAKVFATRANSNVQGVSLLMDGAGDYVTIPDDGWYPNSAFTISSWIKPTAPSNDQPVWYKNGAFSLSMSGVQANQQFDIYQPSFDTTRNVFVENVYGDVTNDTVYSTDGNTLLAYFRNDSLFHLSPYGISGIASNDTVYQQVSPYNIKYIRNRDMIAGYDTLHHPEYDTYSYPAPADLFGVIANDTVWESDSVRAFYRNDTLFQAEYTPRLEEKGDAYAYMSNDTLYTIGTSDYSVLHHDEFMNNSGTIVAFLDDTYIRYAVYGTGSNPIEGEVYGVLNNDTAWTYSPITVYDLEQTDTLAVRLLDTLYAFSDPSLVAYFKSNDSLFFSELLNASGYVAGTPYSVLYKNTAFNLAQDSIYGIWRGDTLYTHTESFLGVLGMDDTVRLEGDQALVIDNSDRVFTLDYLETITEDSILVRTEYRDVYQLDFEGMFSGGTVTLNSGDLYGDEYVNVMVAYDGAAAVFYVNGKEVAEIAATGTLTGTNDFLLGRENANYYTGYLDEVLVWEKALDSAEAYQNHGRFLIGNEDDMVGYWRFDENVGSYAYDASRDDAIDDEVLKYNRRHAAITNGTWSTEVADPELLGFSGFTDSLGNYTIPAIRYRGAGENFKITPVFLTHEFDPSNRILFIGEGSSIQNDIDFIDISSFKVTGFVRVDPEAFGFSRDDSDAPTCYIEGAVLMLDGVPIVQNNELAQTDASGKFEIQVPIGEHFISVIKNGHTFSLGQWPVNTDVHDFQEPISGITFYDETKRYWVGKVVGGTVEGEKFPGFGNVVNNVGKADITITSLGNECFEKDFSTDPLTGEFHVALPPLKYRVEEIEVPAQGPTFNQELRALADEMIDMADIYMTDTGKVNYDTVYFVDNGDKSLQNIDTIKELRYHLHRDYIYQALPEILVLRGDSATHLGDDTLAYADDLGAYSFKIPLQNQPFEHPVFSGGSPYSMWISVNERYFNYDADPSNPVVYSSRIPDASIEISNEIAGAVERLTLQSGDTLYVFDAGMPQTQEGGDFPLTRTLEVSGPRGVKWLPNVGPTEWEQTFRGYVLGTRPQGDNDFITVYDPTDTATEGGVKMVDFILRDPPGSQSYAYWKEGTTVKTYTDNKFSVGYLGQTQWWAGSKFTLYNFLGGAKLTENEGSIIHTVFGSVAAGGRFVRGTTHTTRTTITTNKDAYKPGAPSDIFVGSARNVLVGFSDAVQLIPVDKCGEAGVYCIGETFTNANGTFQLAKYEEFIVSPEQNFATTFVYTQDHIEREMKTLAEKRDRLFATAFYTSKVSSTHPAYGMNNDDPELTAHGLVPVVGSTTVTDDGPSYTYHRASDPREVDIDLVRFYNNQISVWEQTLAKNEEEKIQAMIRADAGQSSRTNYSFGSGVKIEGSESTTDRTLNSVTWEFEIGYKYGTLLDNNSAGVKVKLEAYSGIRGKENGNYTYDSTSTTEIGYVLHDKDINDQISVDVIESHANNGPIFVTKGGRTSCPWEPEATVKYFQEELGTPLSAGTVARDQPTIDIFPRTLYNVPAGEKATFRVILGNNNYTDSVRFYSLLLDSRTNPDGAEIRIDEQRIVKSWPVPMYAGELQEKTLNLQITATEFEYEDLLIYFHSPCQFNLGTTFELSIFDTASISAYFIPECTDVLLRTPTDKWTLNYEFNDTLDVAIGGYNYNYYQFDNVKFQMKESSESDERWLTWNTFWHENSEDIPNEPNLDTIPDDQFNIDYFWDVAQLTDGAYDLRAITTCGPEDVVTTSPVYSGIIDRVNPHPFGRPQPRDGILGPGDEIQITFNEKIDAGKLTWDNFDIRGVLNGGNLRHGASVYFDGSVKDYLRIDGLRMKAQSFTLEFWAKRLSTGEEIILSQGRAGTPQMTVGFNQNDRFYLDLNGAIIVSDAQFTDNKWHHFAVSYDRDLDNARLYADGGVLKVRDDFIVTYQGEGPLYVARRGHAPEDPFEGQVHELRFWRKGMLLPEIAVNFGKRMTGREMGLGGCWPLNESEGAVARDQVAGRNAEVYGDWAVEPGSRSLVMDGNDFVSVPTGHFGFTTEMDFTVEFWFKSAGSAFTLLSNGKGNQEDESEVDWSIEVDDQQRLVVYNNGFQFVATDSNFMDSDWHHFALAISRLGNTRAYVDGNLQNQIGSESFTGFGSDKAWIGARGWKVGVVDSTDRFYTGHMDEVRIWGVARTQEQILRERNYRLLGNEFGLTAYYPFEAYQEDAAGIMLLEETVEDQLEDTVFIQGTITGALYSPETPRIKLQRPIEYVNFVYSVNGDKIIISPTDDDARLENTVLDITVRNVQDNNGNTMQSPVTWTAFIDRNQTIWDESSMEFVKQVDEALTFTTEIKNKGGNIEEFVIDNLPAWLTADPEEGSINPLTSQEITFTVNPGLNIGQYDESLHLRTSFGFNEVMHLGMTVYAEAPEWSVIPSDYEYSMSMIGLLKVEGLFSTDEDDLLGAFIGGECRGVVPLQYVEAYDTYIAYLNIYSNVSNGEPIVFQIWDASEGQILTDVTPYIDEVPNFNYTFSANEVVGTSSNPVVFSSNQGVLEQRELPRGWKWISFHLDSDMLARTSLTLQHLDLNDGDIIWSGDGMFDQYDSVSGLWIGTLAGDNLANGVGGLSNTATYKLKLASETQLTYQGAVLEPSANPVTINRGWNWVGFVSRRNLELNEALANYDAQPGDVIKSQHQFAMYDGAIGWIGSLQVMQPGEGYMLWTDSTGTRTYTYPREGIISGRGLPSARQLETHILDELPFDPYQYPSSMSLVAELNVALHEIGEEDRILAMIKDQVHGVAMPVDLEATDHPRFLMTIYGGAYEEDAEISFVWQDVETGEHALLETVRFQDLATLGDVFEPIILNPEVEPSEEEDLIAVVEPQLYPNPFVSQLDVMVPMATEETEASITVLNVEGKVIQDVKHQPLENGVLRWSWDGTTQMGKKCPSGLYLVRVSAGEEAFTFKVVRQ